MKRKFPKIDFEEVEKNAPKERRTYEHYLKYDQDLKNVIDTAKRIGEEKGFKQGFEESIRQSEKFKQLKTQEIFK